VFRGSSVEVSACVDISENFTLRSTVDCDGYVELIFSGGTEMTLMFSRRGFAQFQAQWPALLAKVEVHSRAE
jgi:hypothetical protein